MSCGDRRSTSALRGASMNGSGRTGGRWRCRADRPGTDSLAYVTLNIGLFVAMSLLGTVRVDIALGFGLFAILPIIQLRSSAVTPAGVAYYLAWPVMGLVNGLDLEDRQLVLM